MDQKIRIGVVGGNFGEVHIQGFRHCPEVEVAAVCRRQEELAKTMAQKYQIQRYYTHFQEMMEAAELDAVSLAVPNDLHYPMAVQALENSKHVICEKPLALTVKEAETMLTKAEKTKRIHTIVFDLRFVPAFIRMKELIEQGEVGTIFHVFFSWLSSGRRDQESPYTWRHTKKEAGFGALGDVGVHGIDLIHWMTGDFKKVVAEMAVHVPKHRTIEGSYRKTEVEDSCSFVGELVNGAQILFQASSVASCESTVRLEIHGDQGNLLATLTPRGGDYNGRLFGGMGETRLHKELPIPERLTAASVPQYKNDTPYSLFFAGVARRFVESIESGQPLSPSFRDGVKAQKVLQSLTESWEQRGWSHIS
jgi:predicted dehydrogenase